MQKNKKKPNKKTSTKKRVSSAIKTSKKSFKEKSKKYIYPSFVFGCMLTAFNFIFLIIALYSDVCTGIYMELSDSIILNVVINTLFDLVLFTATFFVVSYLFIEVVIGNHK